MSDQQPQKDEAPADAKKFALKEIEKRMINVFEQSYFSTLANFFSFLAVERLAYNVTENTAFKIEPDGSLLIWEKPPKAEQADVAGSATSQAMGNTPNGNKAS